MPDLITIGAATLASIKTAADIAKYIKESNTSLEEAEIKLKLADLISALADARVEFAEIQHLVLDKDLQIKELQEKLNKQKNMLWDSPYYWHVDDKGEKDGPYCQHCHDKDGAYSRLQGTGDGYWHCTVCDNSFTDSSYKEESISFEPEF